MSFVQKLKEGIPTLSFEFLPPKNPEGWSHLYQSLGAVCRKSPDYVTVTYGAGGSTRKKTTDLVSRIQDELGIEAMAHLTCVGHTQEEIAEILSGLHTAQIAAIMALRGDPPRNAANFVAHPGGFAHASDLIAFIRSAYPFPIGCAYYPEKHPEAESLEKDIEHLKLKQDAGADFAVSQMFFDNASFYAFREKARRMGVTLPLVAGILPITSEAQLAETGICRRCGTVVSESLLAEIGEGSEVAHRGIEFAIRQCLDLLENGVAGIHLYTLNRSASSLRVTEALRKEGYFPAHAEQPAL